MMSELPRGWEFASLEKLVAENGLFSDGDWIESKDQDPNGENRLLQLADIGDGKFIQKSSRFVNNDKFELLNCTELLEGDLLIARMPDPLGRACLMPNIKQRCLTVVDVAIFRAGSHEISHKLLMHFINSPEIRKIIEIESSGTTRKRIARGKLAKLQLPLPPAAEQSRIANKLDDLLTQADTLKTRIEAIPHLIKRFRQSILSDATSGRLTKEWRDMQEQYTPLIPEAFDLEIKASGFKSKAKTSTPSKASEVPGWISTSLGTVFSVKSGDGLTSKEMDENGEIPVYGGNGVNGYHSKHNISTKSVVIGRVGYYCGAVHFTPEKAWITDNALLISYPKSLFEVDYIYWLLLGTDLRKNTSSSAQPVISGEKIYPINLQIPPLAEQLEIARRIEHFFNLATRLESQVEKANARIDGLYQSILAKAFRGELVPQNPDDEPANILLHKLQQISSKKNNQNPAGKSKDKSKPMQKLDIETVRTWIIEQSNYRFTFDELRSFYSGEYEDLKDIVFKLLTENNPIINQNFDKTSGHLYFARV